MSKNKPAMTPVVTLEAFKLPTIELDCRECDRRGKYNRTRAIERYGPDMTLNQFMRLMANCPRDGDTRRPCRVGCWDLLYMFQGEPFSKDKYG